MNFYRINDKYVFSKFHFDGFEEILEDSINKADYLYYLTKMDPKISRRGFVLTSLSQLYSEGENLSLLVEEDIDFEIPNWIVSLFHNKKIKVININYENWRDELLPLPSKWRINVMALGDVGSTLTMGLRLLGNNIDIGIYDRSKERLQRWEYELNQIRIPFKETQLPKVRIINEEDLFNCDMFVFCASKGIPPVGTSNVDVRMVQFESNSQIISEYAKLAREKNFKGIFSVVSDPVDPLCKVAFLESNKDQNGNFDFNGLGANQIIGYGLGVMNARACYYSELDPKLDSYLYDGQVFGPHGQGLIVVNSMLNYDEELSNSLTEKTLNANLEVRKLGFKPYVAPSLSSGALSILATINGEYFYGSSLMGEAFIGAKMRLTNMGIEIPRYKMQEKLFNKLCETYNQLRSIK